MLIGGEWVDAADDATPEVRDPATGEIITTVPAAGARMSMLRSKRQARRLLRRHGQGFRAEDRERLIHRLAELSEPRIGIPKTIFSNIIRALRSPTVLRNPDIPPYKPLKCLIRRISSSTWSQRWLTHRYESFNLN